MTSLSLGSMDRLPVTLSYGLACKKTVFIGGRVCGAVVDQLPGFSDSDVPSAGPCFIQIRTEVGIYLKVWEGPGSGLFSGAETLCGTH